MMLVLHVIQIILLGKIDSWHNIPCINICTFAFTPILDVYRNSWSRVGTLELAVQGKLLELHVKFSDDLS